MTDEIALLFQHDFGPWRAVRGHHCENDTPERSMKAPGAAARDDGAKRSGPRHVISIILLRPSIDLTSAFPANLRGAELVFGEYRCWRARSTCPSDAKSSGDDARYTAERVRRAPVYLRSAQSCVMTSRDSRQPRGA